MKATKKLLAFLLAATMLLAILPSAFAVDAGTSSTGTYTITIKNDATGHTYEAYQIFAGDLSIGENSKKVLSNITWGSGISEAGKTALGDAAEKAATLTTEAEAKSFAKSIASYLTNPTSSTQGTGSYTISNLSAGYYLVKDKDNSLSNADDFYTAYIMEVVGNVEAKPKGDKPTLDKQIKHNDDGSWGVVGDNQIGDTVEFRTKTTVPDTTGYTSYTYVIHDTMSAGLTSNVKTADDVTIKVGDTTDLDKKYYTVAVDSANSNSFTVTVDIIKAVGDEKMSKGSSLYTYYSGILNKDALIYDQGKQDNTAYLEYSNNPNSTTDKTETPKKTVYDWTFKMGVNKVAPGEKDEETKQLTGAKFVLSKKSGLTLTCDDKGVPSVTTDLIAVVAVDGGYRVALPGESGATYVMEAGSITIKGLDDATDYYLYETKAPEGYNALKEPVHFNITAAYDEDGSKYDASKTTVTVDSGEPSSALSTNVVNQAGSSLPSTGGMGTTIFYVLGSILAIGAAILLISKKRMNSAR